MERIRRDEMIHSQHDNHLLFTPGNIANPGIGFAAVGNFAIG